MYTADDTAQYTIRTVERSEYEAVRAFLSAAGWSHRVGDAARFAALLDNSQRKLLAACDGVVVGFARAITDEISNGYLSMLAVDPVHRGRGLGRLLVEAITAGDPGITWVLRAGRNESVDFFQHVGFRRSTCAWERMRQG